MDINIKKYFILSMFGFGLLVTSFASHAIRYHHNNVGTGGGGGGGWVCYDQRQITKTQGYTDVHYYGCFKSYRTCRLDNANHFGRYSSNRAQKRAYWRCVRSNPKFVD